MKNIREDKDSLEMIIKKNNNLFTKIFNIKIL